MEKLKVQIISRHRLATDGEGVTTLVGLMGCPLKCKYCLNMDVIKKAKFIELTPEELLDKVMIDFCYFVSTKGGITFGGAEPLLQIKQILRFIDILPEYVGVNIESSLNVDVCDADFTMLADKANSFIIDIKALDDKLYREYTGRTNALTLKNLERLSSLGHQSKCRIRIPIIPDYKDEETAKKEANAVKDMGFSNVEIFNYIVRDYMIK